MHCRKRSGSERHRRARGRSGHGVERVAAPHHPESLRGGPEALGAGQVKHGAVRAVRAQLGADPGRAVGNPATWRRAGDCSPTRTARRGSSRGSRKKRQRTRRTRQTLRTRSARRRPGARSRILAPPADVLAALPLLPALAGPRRAPRFVFLGPAPRGACGCGLGWPP